MTPGGEGMRGQDSQETHDGELGDGMGNASRTLAKAAMLAIFGAGRRADVDLTRGSKPCWTNQ